MEAIQTELKKLVQDYIQRHPDGVNKLAAKLLVETKTIRRWAHGVNLPVPALAEKLVKVLRRKAAKAKARP